MKKRIEETALVAMTIMLTACSSLKSPYFPGEKVVLTNGFLAVESDWTMYDEGVYHVRCTESNTLVIAAEEWDKGKGDFKIESSEAVLSELDDQKFLSMMIEDEREEELYTIFRAVIPATKEGHPETLILFSMDEGKIKADAKAGKIAAHATNCGYGPCDIVLEGSKAEQDAYFRNNPNSLFVLDSAVILKRVAERDGD
jgi:hypothetical protein